MSKTTVDAANPATEELIATMALCGPGDVDRAVGAAHAAFGPCSATLLDAQIALVERRIRVFGRRYDELARAITIEMGAHYDLAHHAKAECGLGYFGETIKGGARV